jgi:hypothetical protein
VLNGLRPISTRITEPSRRNRPEIPVDAHGPRLRVCHEAVSKLPVGWSEPRGNEGINVSPCQLFRLIPEELLGSLVRQHNGSVSHQPGPWDGGPLQARRKTSGSKADPRQVRRGPFSRGLRVIVWPVGGSPGSGGKGVSEGSESDNSGADEPSWVPRTTLMAPLFPKKKPGLLCLP